MSAVPPRLTSALFVAALIRSVQAKGGFGYVARHGNDSAGAVFVALHRHETSAYDLYVPAPPIIDDADDRRDRAFVAGRSLEDSLALRDFADGEARFDPDFWLVEIENLSAEIGEVIRIIDPD